MGNSFCEGQQNYGKDPFSMLVITSQKVEFGISLLNPHLWIFQVCIFQCKLN